MIKKGTLVEIHWRDAYSNPSNFSDDEVEKFMEDGCDCTTAGYLAGEDKKSYTLSMTQNPTKFKHGHLWNIPKAWIKKVRRLK